MVVADIDEEGAKRYAAQAFSVSCLRQQMSSSAPLLLYLLHRFEWTSRWCQRSYGCNLQRAIMGTLHACVSPSTYTAFFSDSTAKVTLHAVQGIQVLSFARPVASRRTPKYPASVGTFVACISIRSFQRHVLLKSLTAEMPNVQAFYHQHGPFDFLLCQSLHHAALCWGTGQQHSCSWRE